MDLNIPIAYVIQELGIGGRESQLLELVKGIDRKRFDPIVIYYRELNILNTWNRIEYEKLGISMIKLKQRCTLDPMLIFNLNRLFKDKRIRIVHCWGFNANFHGSIAAKIVNDTPIIITSILGKDPGQSRFPKSIAVMINRMLSRITDLVMTNCKAGIQLLCEKGTDRSKIKCIYSGLDLTRFRVFEDRDSVRRELGICPSDKVVGFVGRLAPVKDLRMLLSAAVEVLGELPNTRFLIVGDGPLRESLKVFARNLGIASNTLFLGNRRDVSKLLLSLDICVVPSLWENCSNTILESMAMGRPVIAFTVGGNPEIIANGVTRFLVKFRSVTDLAESIIWALKHDDCLREIRYAAKAEITKKFALDKMIKDTQKSYITLLNQHRLSYNRISADRLQTF
ncbi:MAG: glycosyltransferase [Candidatus Hodarchaeota archaeon]